MAIKKGDYVQFKDDKENAQYGKVVDTMGDGDEATAKVQHHDMQDDGSLKAQDKHHMLPVSKLKKFTPKTDAEGKAFVLILSDDGDPFKVGDTVVFSNYYYDGPPSNPNQTGDAYIGTIRSLSGMTANVEMLNGDGTYSGRYCSVNLSGLREYMLPGQAQSDEGKSASGKSVPRIEVISEAHPEWRKDVEYKSLGGLTSQSINGRTVDGIAAVMGNIDDIGDITHKGAFKKTIQEQKGRVMFTFNHEIMDLPRARIDELKEISRDELPYQVKSQWPEATGGLFVKRTYLDTPRGDEAFIGVTQGAINEMSYGYHKVKADFGRVEGKSVRNLREVRLIDICDTTFGVNPATVSRKSALPFHETPKAPEDTAWDGPAETKAASIDDLKAMCAWVDGENSEDKGAYKLPHHKAEGDHAVVWAGVRAAMGALLGARGGTKIPEGDRKAVYNHLAKHYKEFDKEPPDFKMLEIADSVRTARGLIAAGVDFKAGRMISAANQAKIKDVIDAIEKQLESLEDMLGTAEPPAEEQSEGKALTDAAGMLALLKLAEYELGLSS